MQLNTPTRQYLSLALLALVWGSSFILMKRGLESFSSIQVAEYRLLIAGIALLPLAIKGLRKFPKKKTERLGLIMVAIFGNGLPAFLFAEAQTKLPSGVTGMLNSLVPLFTLIIGITLFHMRVVLLQFLGVFLGLVGAVTLIYFTSSSTGDIPILNSLMVVFASFCYSVSLNSIKVWLHEVPAVLITSFALMFVIPVVGVGLMLNDFWSIAFSSPQHLTSLGYISLLGIFGTSLALLLFNALVKFTTAVFASSVTYLIPIVAMAWGILDGEMINWVHGVGMALILVGVYIVNRKK